MRVLIVEDEKNMASAIADILIKNNYMVNVTYDGISGLDEALSLVYDLMILDVMLPKMSGISVLKEIRKQNISMPVILLTAKSETEDKVVGLDSGADDYLTKPFKMDELLARLRALSRRTSDIKPSILKSFGDIELNPHTLYIYCNTNSFKLTLKESQLIEMLIEYKNTSVSKERIVEKLWGYDSDVDEHNVEVYISFIRKKLIQLGSNVSIKTVRGVGYCFTYKE